MHGDGHFISLRLVIITGGHHTLQSYAGEGELVYNSPEQTAEGVVALVFMVLGEQMNED